MLPRLSGPKPSILTTPNVLAEMWPAESLNTQHTQQPIKIMKRISIRFSAGISDHAAKSTDWVSALLAIDR
ncbi:hypothetical protein REMIM1_PE00420 (plasmid) [Rhizobium etli bv. mimosae str. Mim1]|nr:hypothetical protein REMIM1_PE00420 [Rhizobium etli bv. mimosae str. Mim1]